MATNNPILQLSVFYVFEIADENRQGLLKINQTSLLTDMPLDQLSPNSEILNQSAKKRIDQFMATLQIPYNLLHTEIAIRTATNEQGDLVIERLNVFDVYTILKQWNHHPQEMHHAKEWYQIDLETVQKAISYAKKHRYSQPSSHQTQTVTPVGFRYAQRSLIQQAKEAKTLKLSRAPFNVDCTVTCDVHSDQEA